MLTSRMILYFLIILLILSYCCESQNEIRKAVRAKYYRKMHEGKAKFHRGRKTFRRAKHRAKAPFNRVYAKTNRKYQNAKRKMQAMAHIINS